MHSATDQSFTPWWFLYSFLCRVCPVDLAPAVESLGDVRHCTVDHGHQAPVFQKRRRRRRVKTMAVGPKQLLKACETITQGKVDLTSWKEKMERDAANTQHEDLTDEEDEDDAVLVEHQTDSAMEMCTLVDELYKDGILTVGCVGFPNVGKSSLINGLVGKKVVSVSRTPGHTKYFQTYFLTPTVKLCDCPGLIFPSLVDRQQQILSGIYPIAQIQEPYTSVGYLAARIPVPKLLKLRHPNLEEDKPGEQTEAKFTAWDICEAWAEKRGYKTAKAARNDVYRAANSILRLTVDGRLCLCMRPPGYTLQKGDWQQHAETLEIAALQEAHRQQSKQSSEDEDEISSSDQEDDEKDHDADEEEEEEEEEGGEGGDMGKGHKGAFLSKNKFALLRDDEC
ncbi:guanine nucleotide-binding protein-like 1 isoform X2 [Mustelus asterias]